MPALSVKFGVLVLSWLKKTLKNSHKNTKAQNPHGKFMPALSVKFGVFVLSWLKKTLKNSHKNTKAQNPYGRCLPAFFVKFGVLVLSWLKKTVNHQTKNSVQPNHIIFAPKTNVILPEIKEFLEEKVIQYNRPWFIETDPIYVPHQFSFKEDIEIAGFLAATLAWGKRPMILKNALKLISLMGNAPHDFVMSHSEAHLKKLDGFVHRTFNAIDAKFFVQALKYIYTEHEGLESVFSKHVADTSVIPAIEAFYKTFFGLPHPARTVKHVADPGRGSAAKRINMFLRWMVRNDDRGVDFGLWKTIQPRVLSCPLDVHSGTVARKLGLLERKQNDIKAVYELDQSLRSMDPEDPVKYDFALFGLGVFEKFWIEI